MYICICHALNERDLKNLVETHGCTDLDDLALHSRAGRSCGCCLVALEEALKREASEQKAEPVSSR